MRNQIPLLQQLRIDVEKNPNDPSLKARLLNVATDIATSTSTMLFAETNDKVQQVHTAAKNCAEYTKNLVLSFEKGSQEFINECKSFASSALELTKALQGVAAIMDDKVQQKKVVDSYNSIKDFAPQIIRAAKRAYENPEILEFQQELALLAKNMATIISHAISVAQIGGPSVEIGKKEETIPLPKMDITQDRSRRRTIRDVKMGNDVLQKARTAAVAQEVNKKIEEGSFLLIQKQNVTKPPGDVPEKTVIKEEDKEVKEQTESFIQTIRAQPELPKPATSNTTGTNNPANEELEQLREENSLLKQQIQELNEEIEALKKKVADRDNRLKAALTKK